MSGGIYSDVLMKYRALRYGSGAVPREQADGEAYNPSCGDEIRVRLEGQNGRLTRVTWELQGCAVAEASSSMVSQRLENQPLPEAQKWLEEFMTQIGKQELDASWGDFQVWNGIERYPARIHCVRLIGLALQKALSSPAVLERMGGS